MTSPRGYVVDMGDAGSTTGSRQRRRGVHGSPSDIKISLSEGSRARRGPAVSGDGYQPRMSPNISGATMVASDSMMNFGVSADSLPQVIFSFGTAPE